MTPYAILGIAPTLERQAIKLAYFAATRRTPPHVDPDAFRAIRSAYEELCDEERAQRAWLRAPLDAASSLERWNARFRPLLDAASSAQRERAARGRALELLIERCASVRPEDLERLG